MEDINLVVLVCRLTADPELRSLPSGQSLASLRVAFNTSKKDNATGQWEDVGNFANVTVWGNQGESCAKHLSKGARVAINGRLQYRSWEDKDGNTRSALEIVANRVQFLESKPANRQADPTPSTQELEEAPF